jgi:hypothetical protein
MVAIIFFVLAAVLFVLAAFRVVDVPAVNLTALGLAFLALGHLF